MIDGLRRRRRFAVLLAVVLVALAWSPAAEAAPPAGDQTGAPAGLVAPRLTVGPGTFVYPAELLAREQPPSGQITVSYVVGVDGIPIEIEVIESPDPALDPVAIEFVAELRYEPATYQGEPVEVELSLGFVVEAPAPEAANADEPANTTEAEAETEAETPNEEASEAPARISGRVREAGYRQPIEGASILAIPAGDLPVGSISGTRYEEPSEPEWTIHATTDADGAYALRGVPEGKVRLIILASGFIRSDQVVELKPDKELTVNVWPRRESTNPYRTEVVVEREAMPEVVERSLELEEIKKVPGSQNDALKAILNFPGVARAPFGSGLLAIRGAAPEDSAVFLGYHEIPLLFHFGGLRSVFASDILAQIDFIPGNFDSRYGDAIGGIVNVQPRAGRRDGYHGYVDINAFDAGFLAEGPIGAGSFAIAGRRSYIDVLLLNALPDDAGLNFTVAPRYWDYQILFDYPVSGGELSVRAFGSSDKLKLVFTGPNDDPDATEDARNQVETGQYFSRADLVYRKRLGPWEFLVTPSFRAGDAELGALGIVELNVRTKDLTSRTEISRQISKRLRWRLGAEVNASWFDVDVTAPAIGLDAADSIRRTVSGLLFRGALYSTATIAAHENFLLYPGVRVEYFAALGRAAVDPRLRSVWKLTQTTALKAAVGLYSQGIQQPVQLDSAFGNPRLGLQKSIHASLALAQELPWDSFIEVTGFYKELWDLVSSSTKLVRRPTGGLGGDLGPEQYANTGVGRIYGMELLLRKNLSKNVFGWVSYTLSRSTRIDAPGEPRKLFEYDQTHILTVIASYKFKRGWQFGARFRLVSGNPYTAIRNGVYDASSGIYVPIEGPINGARLPAFHQLDLRLDKTWVLPILQLTLYVDVQNVYNRQNPEFINYAYDYQSFSTINSLPIIPSIGFRIEL